jgi:SAM-dependent methyltransferase
MCRDVGEGHNRLVEEHHPELAHHHVERLTADLIDLHICRLEGDPAASCRSLSCQRQKRFRNVDANYAPARLHLSRRCDRRFAAAAADIEHALTRPKLQSLKEQGCNAIGENLPLWPRLRPRIIVPPDTFSSVRIHGYSQYPPSGFAHRTHACLIEPAPIRDTLALLSSGQWANKVHEPRGDGEGYGLAMSGSSDLVANGYEAFYAKWGQSPTLRQIWREHITGSDYPEEFAHISFLPLAQLRSLTEGLSLIPGQLLVDLACGAGGPGLWAARESGARLVGIDLSPMAATRASERVGTLGMTGKATFGQGTFEATGLGSATADAVMSVDALQYVPDKTAALVEVARILRPGGRFAFVAFELDPDRVFGLPFWEDAVPDYRPLLELVGFDVNQYSQTPHWADQVAAGFAAILAQQDILEAELGKAAAAATIMEAAVTTELRPYCGHVLAVATRR